MNVTSDRKKILAALNFYEEFLKNISEERFLETPPNGGWSFSEVYSHITEANHLSIIAIEKCLNKTSDIKTRKPHWKVRLILFLGKFPPGKIKAPPQVEAAVKKISKEEASNLLIRMRKKLDTILPDFKKFDACYKFKHPRLGYLDAKSWVRFMLIHTQHHQNQIKRIGKSFSR